MKILQTRQITFNFKIGKVLEFKKALCGTLVIRVVTDVMLDLGQSCLPTQEYRNIVMYEHLKKEPDRENKNKRQ